MPASPATEAMLTIAPRPRSSMIRSAARVHAKVPKRWTSSMRRHSASSMRLVTPSERRAPPMIAWKACSVCARSRGESSPMPALLERMSTVPHSRTTRAKSASTWALSATSVGTAMAAPPSAKTSAATRSAPSRLRSATATCAPSAAKRRAIARPIPDPPPVTTAMRPARRAMRRLSIIHRRESPRAGSAGGGQRRAAHPLREPRTRGAAHERPGGRGPDALRRQTGAEIRGQPHTPGAVTAAFEAVPFGEALHRLLGDQNFALIFAAGGRLKPRPLARQLEANALDADDPGTEILCARLLVGNDAAPSRGGHPLLPQAAPHRVGAGAVAVEVVEPLPHHGTARRPAETRHPVPGEERAQRVAGRVEGQIRLAIRPLDLGRGHARVVRDHVLRVVLVEVPVGDRALAHRFVVVLGARERRHDEERGQVDADLEEPLGRLAAALRAVEGKADHVAAVHRHALAVPVAAHAAVLLLDRPDRKSVV